jgi:hypothetical protein
MPRFDWQDFLTLADHITTHSSLPAGHAEGKWRTAVSRASYAAYHHALNKAADSDASIYRNYTKHERLIEWYKTLSRLPNALEVGKLLDTLKTYRVWADYRESHRITQQMAQFVIFLARNIVRDLP